LKVTLTPCNPAANRSELDAFNALKAGLISVQGDGAWHLFTNLTFSVNNRVQSDEIDVVAVGPPGVRLIEVKHWANPRREVAEKEADRLTMKARRIATTLRSEVRELPHVGGAVLLTRPPSEVPASIRNRHFRGVLYCTLRDWREALGVDDRQVLAAHQVGRISRLLTPPGAVPADGLPRRLGGYVDLDLREVHDDGAHRVFGGIHSVTRDRVALHLYDHSATEERDAPAEARRHHDTLRKLQLYPWAPRIQDSLQYLPGYHGEMSFFTVLDPGAPTMRERALDDTWHLTARVAFARSSIQAVAQLQRAGGDALMVHGNLSPDTILVMHDNSPVITGFGLLDNDSQGTDSGAGPWADVRALRETLIGLFTELEGDWRAMGAVEALSQGQMEVSEATALLDSLAESLSDLTGKSADTPPVPAARYWTEGQIVSFQGRSYRIVVPLGAGGSGTTYKVVELDSDTGEEVGTFVAKVAHDREHGDRIRAGYRLVRASVGRHAGLSAVFEVSREWKENEFAALLAWVDGAALSDFIGLLPLLAEEYGREPRELALAWLRDMCDALGVLHGDGLVHGDVSPRNMIVDGDGLVLTDYDCAARVGDPVADPGTSPYCSPDRKAGEGASRADDLHALAASFFHVLFDRLPFAAEAGAPRNAGLDWRDGDREAFPELVEFLDKATARQSSLRLSSAAEALEWLQKPGAADHEKDDLEVLPVAPQSASVREANEVPRLRNLLTSYPGSRYGNAEARGLDTSFARDTYIETGLEDELLDGITDGSVELVVLCGNAGDGKTALLQYLADGLGLGRHQSSQRVVDERMQGGVRVRINLDGSAAHRGRSADNILDEFFGPFEDGQPAGGRLVHLMAINDGRLLEWIHRQPTGTPIKKILLRLLDGSDAMAQQEHPHVAFHHLNRRSRVGALTKSEVTTDFLDALLRQLYGGDDAGTTWSACRTCSAKDRCRVFEAARVFGPEEFPERAPRKVRETARRRLFDAFQAVHFRGETHITVRELRAALVYILFGTRYCQDYHDRTADDEPAYWDRAFGADSPLRQGDVLRELLRLDPALEAHPKVDRRLLRESGMVFGRSDAATLASKRRMAYFEWTDDRIRDVTGENGCESLGLARGRNLPDFRGAPLLDREGLRALCRKLCKGIAMIGDLPELALGRKEVVPLRITPRTPTETAFWTEKAFDRFRLDPHVGLGGTGSGSVDELHRAVQLVYEYEDGDQERLPMSAELFHRLLRMSEGYQLADISMDDTFARLSIFLQRIAREGDREVMAWNPMRDESVFRISVERGGAGGGDAQTKQVVVIRAVDGEEAAR